MKHPIYKIPVQENFFESLVFGIIDKEAFSGNIKKTIVVLPTQIACHYFIETFKTISKSDHHPITLSINDLSYLYKDENNSSPLERISIVSKLTKHIVNLKIDGYSNFVQASLLAEYFTDLYLELSSYDIDIEKFSNFIRDDLAIHKQNTSLLFEKILPYLSEISLSNRRTFNNRFIRNLISKVNQKNLIIAGINSSLPAIKELMKNSLNISNIHIVFYGIDEEISEEIWNELEPQDNQYSYQEILKTLGFKRNELLKWNKDHSLQPQSKFLSQAFLPAKFCSNWYLEKHKPDNISLYNFADQISEAKYIAELAKNTDNKSILVVCNDEDLIVKLLYFFDLENINLSIIRDYPLIKSKTAVWLELILNFILEKHSIISSLALFKHTYSIIDPILLEKKLREKNNYSDSIFEFKHEIPELEKIEEITNSISQRGSFLEILKNHLAIASNLASKNIWEDEESTELEKHLKQLQECIEVNEYIDLHQYLALFKNFLKNAYYRPLASISRITLCKPIDSRLLTADIVIIAGLNHGIWPSKLNEDPLLSDHLLKKFGLPDRKEKLGSETSDFWRLCNAREVILTRSEKIGSNITLSSSWLLRLKALSCNTIEKSFIKDNVTTTINTLPPPSPCPPVSYRPQKLSATQIEKLIFNPYHIYVDTILRIKKLYPLRKELTAIDFGNFIHKAIAMHYEKGISFEEAGRASLKELKITTKATSILWWQRYLRIISWFKETDIPSIKLITETFGKIELKNNFVICAIADRIEVLDNNQLNIVDYKTGRLSSIKSINDGKTLQLLIEAIIAVNGDFYKLDNKTFSINSLKYIQLNGDEDIIKVIELDKNLSDLLLKTKNYLLELSLEYQKHTTPYHYSKKRTLSYCEYAHLARQ